MRARSVSRAVLAAALTLLVLAAPAGEVKSLLQITAPARTIMFFRVRLTNGSAAFTAR